MIEIKHIYTSAVLRAVNADNLRDANLREADLRDADLREADLRGADLRRANLRNANLRNADLRGANLSKADLSKANLRDANLSKANLSDAILREADLRGADLSEANLRGAKYGIHEHPDLAARVLAQIKEHPETHDQNMWHSYCGTRHCVAGWIVQKAHNGRELERYIGTPAAATLCLLASGHRVIPSFAASASTEEIYAALRGESAEVKP